MATQARVERAGIERRHEIPVLGRHECDALPLALHDEARGDGLHAAGGQPAGHLLPEDGRDLVAVEAVEDPPRLLRVDEAFVDHARLAQRSLDRLAA